MDIVELPVIANSGDPDQTPRSAASDQGLHCLPVNRLGVSSLQWVDIFFTASNLSTSKICFNLLYSICSIVFGQMA